MAASGGFALAAFLGEQQMRVESLLVERINAIAGQVPPGLLEAMRYSVLDGGKRLRPILCLAFADVVTGATGGAGKLADDAACAVELVHTFSLIHDDLPAMDNDDFRRGRPTSHKVFGEAMAILAGDALLAEAFAVLAKGEEPARATLCAELAAAAGSGGMIGGQVLDIAADRPAEQGYLMRLHRLKTGALIRAACRMGVIASEGSADVLRIADSYGEAVGLAFQIADDILDVTGDAERVGKPTGADAAAGRYTFPSVMGLDRSKSLAAERIDHALSAIARLEYPPGPLSALARYAMERES